MTASSQSCNWPGNGCSNPQGVCMRPIPLSGAGETLKFFLGGHTDIYGAIPPIATYVKEGKAKCLLSTSVARSPMLPNAETAADLGMADRATEPWRGVVAPKRLPAARLKVLQSAFLNAAQMDKFKSYIVGISEKSSPIRRTSFALRTPAECFNIGCRSKIARENVAEQHMPHGRPMPRTVLDSI